MRSYDVAIIGGGFCGVLCAKILGRKLSVVLFDKKDHFEFTPAIHKLVISKNYLDNVRVPFKEILRKTSFIRNEVVQVRKNLVVGKTEKMKFRYLVICTGAQYPIFLKNTNNVHTLKYCSEGIKINNELSKAKSVLIIGGGPIGTEIAAELCTQTNKSVTLIQGHDRLLERTTPKASQYAHDFLTKNGVKIVFNEQIVEHTDKKFISNKGNEYSADLGIWCAGIKFKVPFLDKKHFKDSIDNKEHLVVNDYLQLKGFKNVFAGGDAANTVEEKTAQNADRHAKCIAKNIIHLEQNKALVKYAPRTGPLVISLGSWHGILTFKNFAFNGIIPGILKHIIEKIVLLRTRYL